MSRLIAAIPTFTPTDTSPAAGALNQIGGVLLWLGLTATVIVLIISFIMLVIGFLGRGGIGRPIKGVIGALFVLAIFANFTAFANGWVGFLKVT